MTDDYDLIAHGVEEAWLDELNQDALKSRDKAAEQGPYANFVPCPICDTNMIDPNYKGADGLSICDDCREEAGE